MTVSEDDFKSWVKSTGCEELFEKVILQYPAKHSWDEFTLAVDKIRKFRDPASTIWLITTLKTAQLMFFSGVPAAYVPALEMAIRAAAAASVGDNAPGYLSPEATWALNLVSQLSLYVGPEHGGGNETSVNYSNELLQRQEILSVEIFQKGAPTVLGGAAQVQSSGSSPSQQQMPRQDESSSTSFDAVPNRAAGLSSDTNPSGDTAVGNASTDFDAASASAPASDGPPPIPAPPFSSVPAFDSAPTPASSSEFAHSSAPSAVAPAFEHAPAPAPSAPASAPSAPVSSPASSPAFDHAPAPASSAPASAPTAAPIPVAQAFDPAPAPAQSTATPMSAPPSSVAPVPPAFDPAPAPTASTSTAAPAASHLTPTASTPTAFDPAPSLSPVTAAATNASTPTAPLEPAHTSASPPAPPAAPQATQLGSQPFAQVAQDLLDGGFFGSKSMAEFDKWSQSAFSKDSKAFVGYEAAWEILCALDGRFAPVRVLTVQSNTAPQDAVAEMVQMLNQFNVKTDATVGRADSPNGVAPARIEVKGSAIVVSDCAKIADSIKDLNVLLQQSGAPFMFHLIEEGEINDFFLSTMPELEYLLSKELM